MLLAFEFLSFLIFPKLFIILVRVKGNMVLSLVSSTITGHNAFLKITLPCKIGNKNHRIYEIKKIKVITCQHLGMNLRQEYLSNSA